VNELQKWQVWVSQGKEGLEGKGGDSFISKRGRGNLRKERLQTARHWGVWGVGGVWGGGPVIVLLLLSTAKRNLT